MWKVNNEQVVRETAVITYKAEKKRNLLSITAAAMASFFIAVVCAVGVSYWNSLTQMQLRMQGIDYDIELEAPSGEQVELVRAMDRVRHAGVFVSCAAAAKYEEKSLAQPKLFWADETCWEKQIIPALEEYTGHYPVDKNEIMLSMPLLSAMGLRHYETGMKLTLTYVTFAEDSDGSGVEQEFVLSGWYKDYSGKEQGYVSEAFFDASGVKQTDEFQGSLKIKLKNPLYTADDIQRMSGELGVSGTKISADDYTVPNFCRTAAALTVLLFMISASAYLFIYNTMYISVTRNIRYYGQLKTIGMTSVQLKGVVYRQAAWNCMFGIPAGLLCAGFVSDKAVPAILHLVNEGIGDDYIQAVPAGAWVFLTAGGFALFTDFISCRKPAKMAGNCSPIEAMRYIPGASRTGGNNGRHQGVFHTGGNNGRHRGVFRTGGNNGRRESASLQAMAWQNMMRDKKQTAVIVLSSALSLAVFFTVNAAVYANDAARVLNQVSTKDIQFVNIDMLEKKKQRLTDGIIAAVEATAGVQSVRKVTSTAAVIPYQEEVFGAYYRALYESRFRPGNYEEDMEGYRDDPAYGLSEYGTFSARFIGISREEFDLLNKEMENTLDADAFENGEFAVTTEQVFVPGDFGIAGKTVRFLLPDGLSADSEYSIPIAAVTDLGSAPEYLAGGYTPNLIVSEKYARSLLGETLTELINVVYEEPFSEETEEAVKAVFADEKKIVPAGSKLGMYSLMRSSQMQVKVLGYTIGVIMALLALLNYINMTAAGIQNRIREFATLESIGMTGRQIKKMLFLEGAGYGIISVTAALAAGVPFSYAAFDSLCRIRRIPYALPWASNLALFAAAMLACMLLPGIFYGRMQQDGLIERLAAGGE